MRFTAAALALLLPLPGPRASAAPEVAPFVGLKGVSLVMRGLGPSGWSVIGYDGTDPDKDFKGFSRTELDAIEAALLSSVSARLAEHGVPALREEERTRLTPELLIEVSWLYDPPRERFPLRVDVQLREAASRVRDGRTVWAPSWSVGLRGFSTQETFRKDLETSVLRYVAEFIQAHERANRSVTPRGHSGPVDERRPGLLH